MRSTRGAIGVRFSAAKLYLIAASSRPALVHLSVDKGGKRAAELGTPTLHTLIDGDNYREHLLEPECAKPGLSHVPRAAFG